MLAAGFHIGPYEVTGPIGSGGMGDVLRARDARLGRDVAIKALPAHAGASPDRIRRFQREAQILATLNHPHIAAIDGIEEVNRSQFLILELVEGGTLAERLSAGPLRVRETLAIAREIADALHAAHEKGIIHRDLKPANIALTRDGRVKVLDFGVAKTFATDADAVTVERAATQEGFLVGTAAYMSPEQTRGLPVDKRTDVWAFGCVLYEMLTAHRPFSGATVSDLTVAILDHDPDWTRLPAAMPARVQWLVRRCLEKDTNGRLHDWSGAAWTTRPSRACDGIATKGNLQALTIANLTIRDVFGHAASWSRRTVAAALQCRPRQRGIMADKRRLRGRARRGIEPSSCTRCWSTRPRGARGTSSASTSGPGRAGSCARISFVTSARRARWDVAVTSSCPSV